MKYFCDSKDIKCEYADSYGECTKLNCELPDISPTIDYGYGRCEICGSPIEVYKKHLCKKCVDKLNNLLYNKEES